VEIGTRSRIPTTPSMVQLVTKPLSSLKGGTSLKIIPLPIQTFTIRVSMPNVVSQPMEGSGRYDKK
jgi:hypothetical protein